MRRAFRRFYMGMATVLGVRRLGYFIPYRYAGKIPPQNARTPYGKLEALFGSHEPKFHDLLSGMRDLASDLRAIGDAPPPAPRWDQDWFPGLDGATAYTLVRRLKPQRIVEVGSGHSTRFMARAVKDGNLMTSITAIDPAPRADITQSKITVIKKAVQEAGLAPFKDLAAGDFLSIDSSHLLMPGSDVDMLFSNVLPGLPEGVIVHIHDIFLPDAYPASWEWRSYNEQLALPAMLHGGAYQLLWSSRYVRTRFGEHLNGDPFNHIAPPEGGYESSLWIRKCR